MVWRDWWPYDPEPVSTNSDPYLVRVQKNKVYWWCSCGLSAKQPWCDGAHRGTPFRPVMYVPQLDGLKMMCGCKMGGKRPLCNGNHIWVKANHNTPKAAAATFGLMFCFSVMFSWICHP